MKLRAMLRYAITVFTILMVASCSLFSGSNNTDSSADDLLGEWEYLSSENGSANLAYDIEFLSNGTLRITEDADVLVDEYQYEVTKPGKMTVSALGVERDLKFEINENILVLRFGNGENRYIRDVLVVEQEPLDANNQLIEETPTPSGDYSFQVPDKAVVVAINPDASISIDYTLSFVNDPGAHEIDIVDIGLPVENYDFGSITADIDGKPIGTFKKSDIVKPGIMLYLNELTIPPGQKGTIHVNIPTVFDTILPASQEESEEYASLVFWPHWYNSQFCHGTTSYQMTIILPPGVTESEGRFYIPEGWPGSTEPETELTEDGRFSYTWVSDQANAYTQYSFGVSIPSRYLTESKYAAKPSEYFMSLPTPVKVLDKPNGRFEMFSGYGEIVGEQNGILWLAGFGGLTAFDIASGEYKHYTTFDGLPNNVLYSLLVTSDNSLIAGYFDSGIYSFSGNNWKSLDSQGLTLIIGETADGVIWATDGSYPNTRVGQFHEGYWEVYDSWNGFVEGAGMLVQSFPFAVISNDGDLWAQTTNLNNQPILIKYHNGRWTVYKNGLPAEFTLLAVNNAQSIWIMTDEGNILTYDGEKTNTIAKILDLNLHPDVDVVSLSQDNVLTIKTSSYHREELPKLWQISDFFQRELDLNNSLSIDEDYSAYVTKDNQLWISSKEGLSRMVSTSSRDFFPFPTKMEFGIIIDKIAISNNGLILVTSDGKLMDYGGSHWSGYTNILGNKYVSTFDVAEDGSIWFIDPSNEALNCLNNGEIITYDKGNGLGVDLTNYGDVIDIGLDGKLRIGTYDGLFVFNGNDWESIQINENIGFERINSIVSTSDGAVWLGGYDYSNGAGIAKLEGNDLQYYHKPQGLDAGSKTSSIEISPTGTVYAGTEKGLYKLVNNNWEEVGGTLNVNDIAFEGDGSVWVATEFDGIIHYKNGELVEHYTHKDGLPSYRMNAIAVAPDGSIWAGGWGGVVKITPKE